MLFLQRGYDAVTVNEIAEAANVSKVTAFKYFPRKEDMFFDRAQELTEQLTAAITTRPPSQNPVAAVRELMLNLQADQHPLSALADRYAAFFRVVLGSTALRARARELVEEAEATLADLLAEAMGVGTDDARPRLYAALTMAACRAVYVETANRLLAGETAEAITPDITRLTELAFDAAESAYESGLSSPSAG